MNGEFSFNRRDFIKAASVFPAACVLSCSVLHAGPLRCGFVGIGRQGQKLMGLVNSKYITIKALYDTDCRCSNHAAEEHSNWLSKHNTTVYYKYEDLLKDKNIDAVIIAAPLKTHYELAIQALQAGKHVFVERMMAVTPDECRELVSLAHLNNLKLQVGHPQFYSPVFWNAFQVIHSGILGSVYHIRIETKTSIELDKDGIPHFKCNHHELAGWQLDDRESYGLWSEPYCDWTAWVHGLFPKHKPMAVQAHTTSLNQPDMANIDTNLYAMIEYDYGLTVTFSSIHDWSSIVTDYIQIMGTWGSLIISCLDQSGFYQVSYQTEPLSMAGKYDFFLEFIQEKQDGSLVEMSCGSGCQIVSGRPTKSNLSTQYELELNAFSHSVKTNAPILCDGAMGMSIANTCFAAQQAAKSHKSVDVKL